GCRRPIDVRFGGPRRWQEKQGHAEQPAQAYQSCPVTHGWLSPRQEPVLPIHKLPLLTCTFVSLQLRLGLAAGLAGPWRDSDMPYKLIGPARIRTENQGIMSPLL